MRLEVFNIIDESLSILTENKELYTAAADRLRETLLTHLNSDNVINIVSRIKENNSLKEKIIRKKLYHRYDCGQEIMDNLSDVIGIRVECRFIKDEILVYNELRQLFSAFKDGYFYLPLDDGIGLELTSVQPQKQRNGADIFRIDGIICQQGQTFRFELQIKSLVRVFWAEIEHKIVYKNNSYRLIDDFFQNLMLSINNNLVSIDQQLMLVYEQMQQHDGAMDYMQQHSVKNLLAKAINDLLYNKMKEEMGFTINFKQPCEVLAEFVLENDLLDAKQDRIDSMEFMVMMLFRIHNMHLDLQNSLEIERALHTEDNFSKNLGETLRKLMNEDFEWNLFFRILFIMEPNNNAEDLEFFINYLRKKLIAKCSLSHGAIQNTIIEDLLEGVARNFAKSPDISFISNENLESTADMLARYLEQIVSTVDSQEEWERYKTHFLANTTEYIPA